MKKIILFFVAMALILFFPFSNAAAAEGNGKWDVSLIHEIGYTTQPFAEKTGLLMCEEAYQQWVMLDFKHPGGMSLSLETSVSFNSESRRGKNYDGNEGAYSIKVGKDMGPLLLNGGYTFYTYNLENVVYEIHTLSAHFQLQDFVFKIRPFLDLKRNIPGNGLEKGGSVYQAGAKYTAKLTRTIPIHLALCFASHKGVYALSKGKNSKTRNSGQLSFSTDFFFWEEKRLVISPILTVLELDGGLKWGGGLKLSMHFI